MSVIGCAALLFIVIAGMMFNSKLCNIPVLFSLFVYFTQVTLVLFLFSMIDQITLGVIVSILIPFVYLFFCVKHVITNRDHINFKKILSQCKFQKNIVVGLLFTSLFLVVFALTQQDLLYWSYDTFSHWGLVVKEINQYGKLPNFVHLQFADYFLDYPPASGLFLYWFGSICGFSEPVILCGQFLFYLSIGMCLFQIVQRADIKSSLLVCLSIFFMLFSYAEVVTSVLIDLQFSFVPAVIFLIYLELKKDNRALFVSLLSVMPYCALIKKSSLVLLCFVIILMILDLMLEKNRCAKRIFAIASGFLVSGVSVMIWNIFVKLTASNNVPGKFSQFQGSNIFLAEYHQVIKGYCGAVFRDGSWIAILWILIAIFLAFKINNHRAKEFRAYMVCLLLFYVVWAIQVLGMFVFYMPLDESLEYASLSRYLQNMTCFIMFIAIILTLRHSYPRVNYLKKRYWCALACVFVLILVVPFNGLSSIGSFKSQFVDLHNNPRYVLRECIHNSLIGLREEAYDGYTIYVSYEDLGYTYFLGLYTFLSGDPTRLVTSENLQDLQSKLLENKVTRLVVLSHDKKIDYILEAYGLPLDKQWYDFKIP